MPCVGSLTITIPAHSQCLASRAGAFLPVTWVATKALFVFLQESPMLSVNGKSMSWDQFCCIRELQSLAASVSI
jgi:hypothetical protein